MKVFFKAVPLSALVAVLWIYVSWYYVGWYRGTLGEFTDQQHMQWVLEENAPNGGTYAMPYPFDNEPDKGSSIFVSVWPMIEQTNFWGMVKYMIVVEALAVLALFWLQVHFRLPSYWQRVGLNVAAAGLSALMICLHQILWWGFSIPFMLVISGETLLNGFFTGLVLAAFISPETLQPRDFFA